MNPAENGMPRRSIYVVLIIIAVAAACGRILSVQRVYEPQLSKPSSSVLADPDADPLDAEDIDTDDPRGPWPKDRPRSMPTHGANDRSRWATIRALVEDHTYVIGKQEPAPVQWPVEAASTVGLMASPQGQGPFLAVANQAPRMKDNGIVTKDGWGTIDKVRDPHAHDDSGVYDFYSSKPPLLPTLLAGEYWLLRGFGLSIVTDRWAVVRIILLTINAMPWLAYLWLLARVVESLGTTDWGRIFVIAAACFGTLITPFLNTLNNHTIAACTALFALYPVLMSFRHPLTGTQTFAAGFFAGFTACMELPAASFLAVLFVVVLWREPRRALIYFLPAALVPLAAHLLTNYLAIHQLKSVYGEFGIVGGWYDYPGSHWNPEVGKRTGIDWASTKEGWPMYAFHLLLGHHGLFSLTPIFLLAAAGVAVGAFRLALKRKATGENALAVGSQPRSDLIRALPILIGMTLLLSVVVLGFYVFYDERNRNYGGWACGPRWLLWLTPFFLLTMIPACDWLAGRRWGRGVGYILLAVSVVSASYPAWSPWRHPWLYNLIDALGGIPYNHPS
jgi:hypothetical protein